MDMLINAAWSCLFRDVQFKGTCTNCDNKFEIFRPIISLKKRRFNQSIFYLILPLENTCVSSIPVCQKHSITHLELHLFFELLLNERKLKHLFLRLGM
jgi:hypothetical protein